MTEAFAICQTEIGRVREGAIYKHRGAGKVRMLGYCVDDRTGLELVMYQSLHVQAHSGHPLDGRVHTTTPVRFTEVFKPSMDPGDGWVNSVGASLGSTETSSYDIDGVVRVTTSSVNNANPVSPAEG